MVGRQIWVLAHRYGGLALTAFLVVVGLSGSLLAFYNELERLTAPRLFPVVEGAVPFAPAQWAETIEARDPRIRVHLFQRVDDGPVIAWVSPRGETPTEPDYDQVIVDPRSGEVLGQRRWGDLSQGVANLMPFVFRLHFSLALGEAGAWVLGIAALLWTIDCFVGMYLTLPPARARVAAGADGRPPHRRWSSWRAAWKVRRGAGVFRFNFDLHRAGGLWSWFLLLVFAWSSVYMNLHDSVYAPVMRLASDYPRQFWEWPPRDAPLASPRLGWHQAGELGVRLMGASGERHGFEARQPVALAFDRDRGIYVYSVRSSLDFQDRRGRTHIAFDADTGELRQLLLPRAQQGAQTVTNWLASLHEANVFGLPYRILVCLLGLVIVMLAVTGVVIWFFKRRARQRSRFGRACRIRRSDLPASSDSVSHSNLALKEKP